MSNEFRIPVEQSYLSAVGRATYNFAYLEWGIVWIVEKLRPGYLNKVRGHTVLGVTRGHVGDWLSGRSKPKMDVALKLRAFLDEQK